MKLQFIQATPDHAEIIGSLVVQLTQEICERTHAQHFDIDLAGTVQRCAELLSVGHYAALLAGRIIYQWQFRPSPKRMRYMPAAK